MNIDEIEKKYGEKLLPEILEYLDGCSIGQDEDGIDFFQEKDVDWAYRETTGQIHPTNL